MPYGTFLNSSYLNGGTPTALRGLPFLALSGSGYVVNTAGTTDSGGGRTNTTTHGGTIACRIDYIRKTEEEVADRIADVATHLITLPPGTEIDHKDQFYSLDEDATYEVVALEAATADWMQKVQAVKVD